MKKKALIFENKIVQIETESFDVANPLFWIDCPDDCNMNWSFNGVDFIPPPEKTPEQIKAEKKAKNAAARYAKEISGVYYDGHLILTEREDVNILNSAMEKIRRGLVPSISWKCGDGSYIDLTNDNIFNIELSILTHIQTSFSTEKAYNEAIESATTIEELNAIDLIY